MAGFPAPNSTDPEDVTWALETAAALWRRGDRVDALSWVKRAAQAAGEAQLDERAFELARQAADLAEPPSPPSGEIEIDLDAPTSLEEEISELEEIEAAPAPVRPAGPPRPPPRAAPPRPPPPARPAPAASAPAAVGAPAAPADQAAVTAPAPAAPAAATVPAAGLPLSSDLTPAATAAVLKPAAKPASLPTAARPPAASAFVDERTETEWPPTRPPVFEDSTTDVSWPVREPLPSIEETVTEWPPRGAAHLLEGLNFDPPPSQASQRSAAMPPPAPSDRASTVSDRTPAVDGNTLEPSAAAAAAAAAPAAPTAPTVVAPMTTATGPVSSGQVPSVSVGRVDPAREPSGPFSLGKPRSKPAQIDIDDDWFDENGPPTFRPQETPHHPAVPLADLLKRPGESIAPTPTEAEQAAHLAIAPVAAPREAPVVTEGPLEPSRWSAALHDPIGAPPPTQKIHVPPELLQASLPQSVGLDDLPIFGDIPVEQRAAFFAAAKRKTLNAREFVRGFALGVVLRGEGQVTGFNSEVVVARLRAGSVLRARGTAGKALPMRLSAAPGGCDVVTWSEAPLSATFQGCPWVDGELRVASNRTLGLVGAAAGILGSLEGGTLERLSDWLQPRVLGAGEVALHEGEPTPPLLVVGTGTIEIVRGSGAPERTLAPGDLVTPADCARGARAAVTARAGAEGAVVMVVDKARRQAMEAALPVVIALLTGL